MGRNEFKFISSTAQLSTKMKLGVQYNNNTNIPIASDFVQKRNKIEQSHNLMLKK